MCYIYTMKYYVEFKKKEILPFITTWINLEDVKENMSVTEGQRLYDPTYTR